MICKFFISGDELLFVSILVGHCVLETRNRRARLRNELLIFFPGALLHGKSLLDDLLR